MLIKIVLFAALAVPMAAVAARLVTGLYARSLTYPLDRAPARPAAIIFGAGLWHDGSPTPVLRDRVATGAQLYFSGKVQKIIMSGGKHSERYDEPAAMRRHALALGVPDDAILLDYGGVRTYDTCYRARHVFGLSEALLVTQGFHLPRAVYTCNTLGVDAIGVSSDLRRYRRGSLIYWNLREIPATLAAVWDVYIARPQPVMGASQPDRPTETQ